MRLFVKECDDDKNFILVPGYSLFENNEAGVAKVNEVLAENRKPPGKEYYGQKLKQIAEMYST